MSRNSIAIGLFCCALALVLLLPTLPVSAASYSAAAGKAVYDAGCAACHKNGVMGSPKLGDKAAWAPRIKEGLDSMVAKSIKGYKGAKGMMPPKGGNPKLTDAQVGNAVAYLVAQSK